MILIKNAQVFAPKALGKKDVLLAYDKILEIADCIEPWRDDLTVIDAAGKMLVPGFIDQHVHIVGGGGEGGFDLAVHILFGNAFFLLQKIKCRENFCVHNVFPLKYLSLTLTQ